MKVHLQYHPEPKGSLQAAFLRGERAADWWPEMERWGIAFDQLQCYVVPTSLADRKPAGLLVVFPERHAITPNAVSFPCYFLEKKLVIPWNSVLKPAMSSMELDRKLLFPIQFLHPVLGMVGWEKQEQLTLAGMLTMGQERARPWAQAHPGNAPAPPLHEAKVPQPSMDEALDALKDGIDRRPLSELGDKEDDSPWSRFKAGLLKGGLSMTRGLMGTQSPGQGTGGSGFDALGTLSAWLASQMDGLGEQRGNALDKLMDLFDKDPDMALRFAIPLDNPYANRGMGSAGGSLSEKDPRFNLGGIGGGLGGNTWNVESDRYKTMRERYLKAANEAIARGDYDKAAYIFAHLLHDLHGAANVLVQGRMYREAAAIYKEHLKQLPMAAECLEKGGLYLDAIEIYLELKNWEKAGDLYAAIGKKARADLQYERCVEAAMEKADFLEASRILLGKMDRQDRALVTLLQGWQDDKQSEACLKQYLDTVGTVPEIDMAQQIEQLYKQHTPEQRQGSFLTILSGHFGQLKPGLPRDTARSIAYEIVSTKALEGDNSPLQLLPKFVEGDGLLSGDVSRFNSKFKKDYRQPIVVPQLNKNIQWQSCHVIGNQVLAVGQEGTHLWIARFNWQGHVEYYHWAEQLEVGGGVILIPPTGQYGWACLVAGTQTSFSQKLLPQNERFESAVTVGTPKWMEEEVGRLKGLCTRLGGDVSTLVSGPSYASLKRYNSAGELLGVVNCQSADGQLWTVPSNAFFQPMLESHLDVVGVLSDHLVIIDPDGKVREIELGTLGYKHVLCEEFDARKLCAVATGNGCQLLGLALENPFIENILHWPVVDHCFLPGKLLAILSEHETPRELATYQGFKVAVFDISGDRASKEMEVQIDPEESDFDPIAIIPGPHRRSFCILGQNGVVRAYTVEERLGNW